MKKISIGLFAFIPCVLFWQVSWAQDPAYPSDYNSLSKLEKSWLDQSCGYERRNSDFSTYKRCVDKELPGIRRGLGHDLSTLETGEKSWLNQSCGYELRNSDFSTYKRCVDNELPGIRRGLGHDLSALETNGKSWLDQSCGYELRNSDFSTYKRCVDKELPGIRNGLGHDLTVLGTDGKSWLDQSCGYERKNSDFSTYKRCVDKEFPGIKKTQPNSTNLNELNSSQNTVTPSIYPNLDNCPEGTKASAETGTCLLIESNTKDCSPGTYKSENGECVLSGSARVENFPTVTKAQDNSEIKSRIADKQRILKAMKLYDGNIDGIIGAKSQVAEIELVALKAIYKSMGLYNGDVNGDVYESFIQPFNQLQNTPISQHALAAGVSRERLQNLVSIYLKNQSIEIQNVAKFKIQSVRSQTYNNDLQTLNRPSTRPSKPNSDPLIPLGFLFAICVLVWALLRNSTVPNPVAGGDAKPTNKNNSGSKSFDNRSNLNDPIQPSLGSLLLKLYAKLCKIDGVVDKSEIAIVKSVIDTSKIPNAAKIFQDAVKSGTDFSEIASSINSALALGKSEESVNIAKLLILEHLATIILADNQVDDKEISFFKKTAEIFGFEKDFIEHLISLIHSSNSKTRSTSSSSFNYKSAMELLGLNAGYSLTELKAAHRSLARSLHPDILRSQGLPENVILERENLLKKVNVAYEILLKKLKASAGGA